MAAESQTTRDGLERRLFELAADALVVTTPEGVVIRANEAAAALAGRPRDDLVGAVFWDLIHPADHAAVAAARTDAVRSGGDALPPFRFRIVRPDGQCRWVESSSRHDRGTGLHFSVVRDVSRPEDSDLERLAPLFDNAPLGMAVMAPDGTLRRTNHTLERMLHAGAGELVGRRLFDLVVDDDSRAALTVALGTRSRPAFQLETRLRAADGRTVIALASGTLVTHARHE